MTALTAALCSRNVSLAAVTQEVDTIVLEPETAYEDDVPVDLSWKTKQDKGQWIEELGIGAEAKSLVLVVNNLEENEGEKVLVKDPNGKITEQKKTRLAGNSRLFYYSKDVEGHWQEVFATNCYASGGCGEESDIYGAYKVESAFGTMDNPGSLVPYHMVSGKDYWNTDSDSADFGEIYTAEAGKELAETYVNLEEKKAFSNYGMILKPEYEGNAYPALLVNCQQASTNDRTFCGLQIEESYLRMLIQTIDEDTRILVAGTVEDMEGM